MTKSCEIMWDNFLILTNYLIFGVTQRLFCCGMKTPKNYMCACIITHIKDHLYYHSHWHDMSHASTHPFIVFNMFKGCLHDEASTRHFGFSCNINVTVKENKVI